MHYLEKNIMALRAGLLTATVKLVESCIRVLGVHHPNPKILSSQYPSGEKVRNTEESKL